MLGKACSSTSAPPVAIVCLVVVFVRLSFAQDDCGDITNVRIAFNESDTDPRPDDPDYVKIILSNKEGNVKIAITEDNSISGSTFNFHDKFVIGSNSWGHFVRMVGAIDRDGGTANVEDDINILQYQITCRDSQRIDVHTVYGLLKITIVDVNDNAPIVYDSPSSIHVAELTPPQSIILLGIKAVDIDKGWNAIANFSLYPAPGSTFDGTDFFSIRNPETGDILLDRSLDYESMYQKVDEDPSRVYFEFIIFAVDRGEPAQTSTAPLTIYITDSNDLGPTFYYPSCIMRDLLCLNPEYDSYVQSNDTHWSKLTFLPVPRGMDVEEEVKILAYDRDTLNASLECSIALVTPDDLSSYFNVTTSRVGNTNQYECIVYYVPDEPILTEMYPAVSLLLRVRENNSQARYAIAQLKIEVREGPTDNETFPSSTTPDPFRGQVVVSPSIVTGYVNENAPAGSSVYGDVFFMSKLRFTFTYFDSTGGIGLNTNFEIAQQSTSPFQVFQDGRVVVSNATLDFERRQDYGFFISVTTPSTNWSTATAYVTIVVLDVNDNVPVFDSKDSYVVSVVEGNYSLLQTRIFKFNADDADGTQDNNQITYQLASLTPSDGKTKFSLTSDGVLFVTGHVVGGTSYHVRVTATDNGVPSLRSGPVLLMVNVVEAAKEESDDGLGTGLLIGIAVAAILVVTVAIVLIACCIRKRRLGTGGDNRSNTRAGPQKAEEGHHELPVVAATKPAVYYSPRDQTYAYADGFIHEDPSKSQDVTSGYDNEEIYDRINDSEDANAYDTAASPSEVPENSYQQLLDVPPVEDTPQLTPALPKRPPSKDNYYSHPDPIDAGVDNSDDQTSDYTYVQPDEPDMRAGNDPRENEYLQPSANNLGTGVDTNDDGTEATAANKNPDAGNENSLKATEEETQNAVGHESDSKNDYDTLVPDDPNYTNLNPDPREYVKVNKLDEMHRL